MFKGRPSAHPALGPRRTGTAFKLLVLAALALALALGPISAAHAAGPAQFSSIVPAPGGSTADPNPAISLVAYDPAKILSSGYSMTVDGRYCRSRLKYIAVGDATRVTVTAAPSSPLALANGPHTVTVQVTNAARAKSTCTWTFTVGSAPQLSDPTPAAGSTITTDTPAISVSVLAFSPVTSVSATLNGAQVPASYDAVSSKVSVTPPSALDNDADATVEVGQALLQHVRGGIHQAGINVAAFLQGEQACGVFRGIKGVGRSLVDGHGAGAGHRIRCLAGMQHPGAEAVFP